MTKSLDIMEQSPLTIKGYVTPYGYMGLVDGRYLLFATEEEYYEYLS